MSAHACAQTRQYTRRRAAAHLRARRAVLGQLQLCSSHLLALLQPELLLALSDKVRHAKLAARGAWRRHGALEGFRSPRLLEQRCDVQAEVLCTCRVHIGIIQPRSGPDAHLRVRASFQPGHVPRGVLQCAVSVASGRVQGQDIAVHTGGCSKQPRCSTRSSPSCLLLCGRPTVSDAACKRARWRGVRPFSWRWRRVCPFWGDEVVAVASGVSAPFFASRPAFLAARLASSSACTLARPGYWTSPAATAPCS